MEEIKVFTLLKCIDPEEQNVNPTSVYLGLESEMESHGQKGMC